MSTEVDDCVYNAVGGDEFPEVLKAHAGLIDAPNPEARSRTPMHRAAELGCVATIALLVSSGSSAIDATDDQGFTPMHLAAKEGHAKAVEELLQHGSQALRMAQTNGWQPLCLAVQNGHVAVVETVVQRVGPEILEERTQSGQSLHLYHIAASCARVDMISVLMRLGSTKVHVCDSKGWIPLHYSAKHGTLPRILTLSQLDGPLDHPARGQRTRHGWTAIHIAALHGQLEAIELLVRLGLRSC